MWSADDNDLDRAIDAVARQMTAGEPSASLRARVIDRLESPRTTRRLLWIGVPVAAAATLVVAFFVARGQHAGVERTPMRVAVDPSPSVSEPQTLSTAKLTIVTELPAPTLLTIRARRPDVQRPFSSPSEVAALAPDVLGVPTIELTAIDPAESIRLPRLETITPIALQPIGEPQGDRP